MAKILLKKGTGSKLLDIFIQDSSSTTGAGLTGLVYNSAGLTAYYYREGTASAVAITLATMTLGTWATGGFVVIDGTNMPGCYQIGIPDAALLTGANSILVILKGATNMAPLVLEIQLTDVDVYDAVRGGMTSLPASGTLAVNPTLAAVTHTGAVIPTVSTLTGHVAQTGDNYTRLGAPAGATIAADLLATYARIGAPAGASIAVDLLVIDNFVDDLETRLTALRAGYLDNLSGGAVALASACTEARLAELDAANLPADVAAVKADTAAVLVDTGTDGVVVAAASKTGYSLTQSFPTNFSALSITAGGLVDITQAAADKVWSTAARTLTSFGTLVADVWAATTRILTAGTNIALAKGTGVTGFNDITTTDVKTQVDAALDTAGTELSAIPTTTGTLRQKINYLFQYFRNKKTVTATTETLLKEDAATTLGTSTVSDTGVVFTKGEMS